MSVLRGDDSARIERAIGALEQQSAAEFVVAVLPRSATYGGLRAAIAGSWGIAIASAYLELVPHAWPLGALLLQVPVALGAWAALGWRPLFRLLIPHFVAERAVEGRALQLFAERGVHRTSNRTGMLLFVSELERKVVLLGDSGIHERVGNDGWQRHTDHVVSRIREGRAADGVIEVIERLAETLAQHVPIAAHDENELPNRVLTE